MKIAGMKIAGNTMMDNFFNINFLREPFSTMLVVRSVSVVKVISNIS